MSDPRQGCVLEQGGAISQRLTDGHDVPGQLAFGAVPRVKERCLELIADRSKAKQKSIRLTDLIDLMMDSRFKGDRCRF